MHPAVRVTTLLVRRIIKLCQAGNGNDWRKTIIPSASTGMLIDLTATPRVRLGEFALWNIFVLTRDAIKIDKTYNRYLATCRVDYCVDSYIRSIFH